MSQVINPFPGLRPFFESEEHLFFGREHQVDAMVDKLAESRFLAVVGPSGSGKSSLVNCGLQPALHRGLLSSAGTSWKIAKLRPGGDPMRSLARALAVEGFLLQDLGGRMSLESVVDTHLRVSKRGIVELFKRARLASHVNLLVIVDQFEELFRYASLSGASENPSVSEAIAFVNLLLEPATQTDLPIHVAITMRSDFLGDCAQFPGLADAINSGQYLVPRMSREDRRRAIHGPIGVAAAEISPVLLTRLVNDVGDNPDQLSILQHALNRTWSVWKPSGQPSIDLEHYEATGAMSAALDKHADDAYARLKNDTQRKICEKLFKAVSDTGSDARGIRRPTVLRDICAIAGAKIDEVSEVIELFRDTDSSFLMPPPPDALEPDTVIDISHESLMRVWKRLIEWTNEEAEDAERYRRLARTGVLYQRGQAELLAGAELELMLKWRSELQPNEMWAQRYAPGFEAAMAFLDKSAAHAEDVQCEQDAQTRREKRRNLSLIIVGFASLLGTGLFLAQQSENAELRRTQGELRDALNEAEAERKKAAEALALLQESIRSANAEKEDVLQKAEENALLEEQKTRRSTQAEAAQVIAATSSVAQVLDQIADEGNDPASLAILAQSLASANANLSDQQASFVLTTLVKSLADQPPSDQISAVGQALQALEDLIPPLNRNEFEFDSLRADEARRVFFTLGASLGADQAQVIESNLQPMFTALAQRAGFPNPRIYIHVPDESQRADAQTLRERLQSTPILGGTLNFRPIQVAQYQSGNALRCFRADECQVDGPMLLSILNGVTEFMGGNEVQLRDFSAQYGDSDKIRPRHYELWLAPDVVTDSGYISATQLEQLGVRKDLAEKYAEPLNVLMHENGIDTPLRKAHFLAQLLHESASLRLTEENLNYSASALTAIFRSYFKTAAEAESFARQPEKTANRVYANRMGNGDEASGDGWKYRGRGFFLITGRDYYQRFAKWIGDVKVMDSPDLVAEKYPIQSAILAWEERNLNRYADQDDVAAVTRMINGGSGGLADRTEKVALLKKLLAAET